MNRLAVLALVFAACGGAAPKGPVAAEGVEPDEAVREARSLIEEAYASLRRGDAGGLLSFLAPDVFVIGPAADQLLPAGSDALVRLGDWLDAAKVKGGKHKLKSRDLQVVAAPGGRAAWAADQVELDGATYAYVAVLTGEDDLWTFRAVHVARTWKPKQLGKQTRVAGAPLPAEPPPDQALAALATEALGDLEVRLEQMPDDETDEAFDVIVMSTAPRGSTHGVNKVAKAWKKILKKAKKKPRPETELVGEPITATTADGALGWVVANVVTDEVPHRLFFLYAQLDGAWRLMAIQDAAITQ